ncbi:MAG: hypothetical protein NC209_02975 [Alistipes sp.]|nr:hypothetical protein [Alistipes senegalensis]MCM1250092.1 hypothetical protein [Alistipes sp.]
MKKFFLFLLSPALLLAAGCSEEEDVLGKQKTGMVSFLERTHNPRLVPEEEYEEGSRSAFYTTLGDAVYRYIDIEDYFDPYRENWPEVTDTSWVTLTFTAYAFNNAAIVGLPDGGLTESNISRVTMPFYSNDPAFELYFHLAGLTSGAWNFEPLTVDMRSPGIINGLRLALLGCREGDRVEAYMTYNMAYGDKNYMYFLPKETPVAIFFSVDKVE